MGGEWTNQEVPGATLICLKRSWTVPNGKTYVSYPTLTLHRLAESGTEISLLSLDNNSKHVAAPTTNDGHETTPHPGGIGIADSLDCGAMLDASAV